MDLSSAQTAMWQEGLSFQGDGPALPRHAGFATGLERLAAVVQRLREGAGTGVVHAVAGYTGQSHAVWKVRS
jgi:hypothetical protein